MNPIGTPLPQVNAVSLVHAGETPGADELRQRA